MQALSCRVCRVFLITALAVGVARASDAPLVPPRWAQDVQQYERADRQGQAAWLTSLLKGRGETALGLTASPAELQRQRTRHDKIIGYARAGRQLSTAGLVRLLEEVDTAERLAIQRLWRDYEFHAARAFHDRREAFEQRMDTERAVKLRWQEANRPWQQQPALLDWLQAANRSVGRSPSAALPPIPSFSASVGVADLPVQAKPRPPAAHQPSPSQTALRPVPSQAHSRPANPSVPAQPRQRPQLDLAELRARITGYNLALADLMAQLHDQQPWPAARLDRAVDTLAELDQLERDLSLYWNVLAPEVRDRMPAPTPTSAALALIGAKTAAARKHLESSSQAAARANEHDRLDRVSRRLAELAAERR